MSGRTVWLACIPAPRPRSILVFMRRSLLVLLLALSGCPRERPKPENLNPYHDVAPPKIKQQVEQIQQKEDERNDRRVEELK